jgi:hypothetical protein
MSVVYKLIGYSRETERQSVSYDVPATQVRHVKVLAGIDPDDRTILGEVPLKSSQANRIAEVLRLGPINTRRLEFFLAPFSKVKRSAPTRVDA